MQPSHHQFAVAIAAVVNFEHHKRQVWDQPAGTGKSRTLASMVYAFYKLANKTKFNVYFANQEQIDNDQDLFSELNRHLNSVNREVKIDFMHKDTFANKSPTEDALNLIDEADYFLLDVEAFKVGPKGQFVGMTATPLKKGQITLERKYLEQKLGVRVCDSLIQSLIKTNIEPTKTTYTEFFNPHRNSWPKLVYSDDAATVKTCAEEAGPFSVHTQVQNFRQLEDYGVYVICDEVKMRGIDY